MRYAPISAHAERLIAADGSWLGTVVTHTLITGAAWCRLLPEEGNLGFVQAASVDEAKRALEAHVTATPWGGRQMGEAS